jgi:hypothetical protein
MSSVVVTSVLSPRPAYDMACNWSADGGVNVELLDFHRARLRARRLGVICFIELLDFRSRFTVSRGGRLRRIYVGHWLRKSPSPPAHIPRG